MTSSVLLYSRAIRGYTTTTRNIFSTLQSSILQRKWMSKMKTLQPSCQVEPLKHNLKSPALTTQVFQRRYAPNARANGGTRPNTIRKWQQSPGNWTAWKDVPHPVDKIHLPKKSKNISKYNSAFYGGLDKLNSKIKLDQEGFLRFPPEPHIDHNKETDKISDRVEKAVKDVKAMPRRVLKGDWYSQVDIETGKVFYLNRWTGKTTWEMPAVLVEAIEEAKVEAQKQYCRKEAADDAAARRKAIVNNEIKLPISPLKRPFTRRWKKTNERGDGVPAEEFEEANKVVNTNPRAGSIPDWRRFTKKGEPWTVPGTDKLYEGTTTRWQATWKPLRPRPLKKEGVIKQVTRLTDMMSIARNQDYDKLVETLASGDVSSTINDQCEGGISALHFACSAATPGDPASEEILKILLFFGADIHATTDSNKTALHYACETGNIDLVKRLIEAGARIDGKTTSNMGKGGETALHMVCERGDKHLARLLIDQGADINTTSDCGMTPLHFAVHNNAVDIVKMLIIEGANFDLKDTTGRTPLQVAADREYIDIKNHITELQFRRALKTCKGACSVVTGTQGSCTIHCNCQHYRQSTRRYYCVCGHIMFTHNNPPKTAVVTQQESLKKELSLPETLAKRKAEIRKLPNLETAHSKMRRRKRKERTRNKLEQKENKHSEHREIDNTLVRKRLEEIRAVENGKGITPPQIEEGKKMIHSIRVSQPLIPDERLAELMGIDSKVKPDINSTQFRPPTGHKERTGSRRRSTLVLETRGDNNTHIDTPICEKRVSSRHGLPGSRAGSRSGRRPLSGRRRPFSGRGRPISARQQIMDSLLSQFGGGIDEVEVDGDIFAEFAEFAQQEDDDSLEQQQLITLGNSTLGCNASKQQSRTVSRRSTISTDTYDSLDSFVSSRSSSRGRKNKAPSKGSRNKTKKKRPASRRTQALMFQQRARFTFWSGLEYTIHPVTGKKVPISQSSRGWEGGHWAPGREVDRLGADPEEFEDREKQSRYKYGVTWNGKIRKWMARVRTKENTMKLLGYFNLTEEAEAAETYDKAAIELYGEFALTNFHTPDSKKESRFEYGVTWNDRKKRWMSQVITPLNKIQLIGLFEEYDELRAARAYDKAAKQLYGKDYEKLNFRVF